MIPQKEIVVVIGMHRSGTSLLAHSVNLLGFHLGKKILSPANDNPNGFWENDRVIKINDSILKKLKSGWADYSALPENWEQMSCLDEERAAITHLLEDEFEDHDKIAIKDPRLCRTCKLWFPILEERGFTIKIVGTIRHPYEVAESLIRRNSDVHPQERLSREAAVLLWIRYIYERAVNTQHFKESTYIFPDLLESGEAFFDSLIAFLSPELKDLKHTKELVLRSFSPKKRVAPSLPEDSEISRIALSIWDHVTAERHGIATSLQRLRDLESEMAEIHRADVLFREIYHSWKSHTAPLFSLQSKIEAPGRMMKKISSCLINRR